MLPEGWHRSTLGEIARITSGGTPDRSEPSYWGGSVPWVTTGEIQFNTITDTAEKPSETRTSFPLWTDDYASLYSIMKQ